MVVVHLFACFILESHDLETLSANLAAIDGALAHEVKDLLVRVRVIFD